jgi:hypothetical protein
MHNLEEENLTFGISSKILMSIIGIVSVTATFFWGVIIPIQNIQLQLVQIQKTITDSEQKYTKMYGVVMTDSTRISRLEGIHNISTTNGTNN